MDFGIESGSTRKRKKKNNDTMKLLILSAFFVILAIVLIVVYVSSSKKVEPQQPVTPPTVVEEPEPEEPKTLQIVNPESNDRPIAVMIDNNIGEIRHAGLQDAYINYEIIVEGGLTRIMSLYKDKNTNVVGPVRSARNYFLDYALEHDAIYTHFGWSDSAEQEISTLGVNNINGMIDTTCFARDRNLPSPHNVFVSIQKIKDYLNTKQYSSTSAGWQVLNYTTEEVELDKDEEGNNSTMQGLTVADRVSIEYSATENRTYAYDSVNKYYLRSQNGSAQLERKSEHQLTVKNIIIMRVENKTIDGEGRQALTTTGSGTGYYITNGYGAPIVWSKASRTAKTKYTYNDGTEVKIADGNTFIQIVPISSKVEIR